MALELSIEAEAFLQQTGIEGNIILDIKGFPNLYGAVKVTKLAKIGEFIIGDGTLIGGTIGDVDSKDYISLAGTTNNLTQKLEQDKGGSSSITSFKIRLIDKDNEITRDFSPGAVVGDILGNDAQVFWQAQGSKHPQDSARLFVGAISSASFGAGYVDVVVQHPETLKRQTLLPQITTELEAAINDSTGLITVSSIDGFINSQDNLTSYVKIDDEIIQVGSFQEGTPDTLFGCTRGQFGTIAEAHDDAAEVESFYILEGACIELALRLLLSGGEESFATETCTAIEAVSGTQVVKNAVFFNTPNIQDELGIVVGDQMAIISGTDAGNITGFTDIISFGTTALGSYVIINKDMISEIDLEGVCRFKSKYNKLNFGCNLKPYQVDVAQFEDLQQTFGTQFFDYSFPIKDDLNAKEFIDTQIFYPSSLFSLPRQGRVSVGISAPPLVGPNVKTISAETVTNATQMAMTRSINQSFYNSIAFKFAEDEVEDKFKGATVFQSEDSFNRVKVGSRPLVIECGGIKDTPVNRGKIDIISRRFLDRYQYGAEQIKVGVTFKTAFQVEPGDTVILDGESLKISDITQGTREFFPRVMEVTNRSINLKTGKASLDLSDTNLSTRARYGVWSPASIIGAGSTTSNIVLTRSFGTTELELERDKWADYVLQDVTIRSVDHSVIYNTTIIGLSPSNPNILIVNPPIASAAIEGFIIESPIYNDTTKNEMKYYKALHCYFNPQVEATGGTTSTIEVGVGDVDKFITGSPVRIHLDDYSEDAETSVTDVTGTTITLNKTLSFAVTSSHLIDLIGFKDKGSPYRWY